MLGPMTIFWWDTTGGWGPLKWENKRKKERDWTQEIGDSESK